MRNINLTRIATVAVFAALYATSPAQIVKQGGGYLLRMKYTKGAIANYAMTTATSGGSAMPAMNVAMPMRTKVLSVASGVGEVQYELGPISNNGKAMGQKQTVVVKIDSRGKMLSSAGVAQQVNNVTLPEKPVKPGATWTGVQTTQSQVGQMTLNATYKFAGLKTVGGKTVAEIQVNVKGGNQMIQTAGTGSVFLLVSDGSMHSTSMNQTMTMSGGQGGKPLEIKMKVSITRK